MGVTIQQFFWAGASLLVLAVFAFALLFSIISVVFFRPKTTLGWAIRLAIIGVALITSNIVVGRWVDASGGSWLDLPPGVAPWRPIYNFFAYGLGALAFGYLVWTAILRRFFPSRTTHARMVDEDTAQLVPRDIRKMVKRPKR